MPPELIGAVITAGASMANSAINASSTKQNNEMYRRWQLEDRQHDEYYNSPAHQKAMLESAGLAPSQYMDSPVATTSNTVAPEAPQFADPIAPAVDTYFRATDLEANNKLREAEIGKIIAETKSENDKRALEVAKLQNELVLQGQEIALKSIGIDSQELQLSIAKQTAHYVVEVARLNAELESATFEDKVSQSHNATLLSNLNIQDMSYEIAGKKFSVEHLLPKQSDMLDSALREYDDKHEISMKTCQEMDDAHAYALLQLDIAKTDAFRSSKEYEVLQEKEERFKKTIRNQVESDLSNSRFGRFNSSAVGRGANNVKTALQNAEKGLLTMCTARMFAGIGNNKTDWSKSYLNPFNP
ncbi:unnamed protein product, partial [Cylicocyclus nassatus]